MQNSIKIVITKPILHTNKAVRCNGLVFQIPLPINYHFIEIVEQIVINKSYEQLLAIVSKQKTEVKTINQFYKLKAEALMYFNIVLQLNYDDLALSMLSQSQKIIGQLDKFQFKDLLALLKKSYDLFSNKLHNKFNRRLKKYISISQRNQQQKKQLKQLIQIIKTSSTDQQPQIIEKYSKISSQIQPVIEKQSQNQGKIKQEIKRQKPFKNVKKNKVNSEINEQENPPKNIAKKDIHKNANQTKLPHKKYDKNQEEDNQNEWEDVQDVNQKNFKKNKTKKNEFYNPKNMLVENQEEPSQEEQEKQISEEKKSKKYRQRQPYNNKQRENHYDHSRKGQQSKQKKIRDMRVILGINGANDDVWRQRYRVQRIPVKSNQQSQKKAKKYEKYMDKNDKQSNKSQSKIQQEDSIKREQIKVVKVQSSPGVLKKVYVFPQDGTKYKLDQKKLYKIKVNNNFWVSLQKDRLVIQKDNTGWLRNRAFKSNDDFILEAQDITLALQGTCNLQDGGSAFNNPKLSDFTQSQSQWFTISTLEVYVYQ